jgi:hypothetical protein
MNLEFDKVTYDRELADFSEEDLRELVTKFEDAQESNVAEFETAAEAVDGIDESTIEDFEDARGALIEDITESEDFDDVPLTEDKLEQEDFSALRDWKQFVQSAETDTDSDEESDDGEGEFTDMGKKSPKQNESEDEAFAEDALGGVQGLSL